MNQKLQTLKNMGCDIDGAMARTLDDEEFLLECIHDVLYDAEFESLGTALAAGDIGAGFEASHALKGIIANTGLTVLFNEVVKIVEPLRAKKLDGTKEAYEQLISKRDQLRTLMAE